MTESRWKERTNSSRLSYDLHIHVMAHTFLYSHTHTCKRTHTHNKKLKLEVSEGTYSTYNVCLHKIYTMHPFMHNIKIVINANSHFIPVTCVFNDA